MENFEILKSRLNKVISKPTVYNWQIGKLIPISKPCYHNTTNEAKSKTTQQTNSYRVHKNSAQYVQKALSIGSLLSVGWHSTTNTTINNSSSLSNLCQATDDQNTAELITMLTKPTLNFHIYLGTKENKERMTTVLRQIVKIYKS